MKDSRQPVKQPKNQNRLNLEEIIISEEDSEEDYHMVTGANR